MHALRRWGGIYLDTDALALSSLRELRETGVTILGEQEDGGVWLLGRTRCVCAGVRARSLSLSVCPPCTLDLTSARIHV